MRRHSDESARSGALGVMRGIGDMPAGGDDVLVGLETANADRSHLTATYRLMVPPNGGRDDPPMSTCGSRRNAPSTGRFPNG